MDNLFTTPTVIKESSAGFSSVRVVDEMFARREVQCVGEVDRDMAYSLRLQLRYLEAVDPNAEVTIIINSPGGSVTDGHAIYDVMRSMSYPVRTVCLGMAASMAALLFVAGGQRDMLPHSQVMIHDPLVVGVGRSSALELKAQSDDLMRTREISARILAEHTGHTLEEVYEKTSHDCFFDAEAAVAWGLADRVITSL